MSALVLGAVGAYAGARLRLPAGTFIGSLLGVGLALGAHGFPEIPLPPAAGWLVQILIGILVGMRMTRDSLRYGVRALIPASILSSIFLVSSVVAALAAVWLTGISAQTALFAAAPGGLTEMATIGVTQGADGPAVAAVHVSRLLLVIFCVGFLTSRLQGSRSANSPMGRASKSVPDARGFARLAGISAAGAVGGVLGLALTPLPAGGVVGALLGAGLTRLIAQGPLPEKSFQLSVQAIGGAVIGLGLSAAFFQTLLQLAGATVLINAIQGSVWLLGYYFLTRMIGYDLQTAVFASAPGGMGVTLSTVGDTNADLVTVAFTHLFRVCATIITVPLIVALFVVG